MTKTPFFNLVFHGREQINCPGLGGNGVRLVLLGAEAFVRLHAFDKLLCTKKFFNKNVNNANLTSPQSGRHYDQTQ